ncbi:hypothetical protein QEN19_000549 [Hanseniaspora menglaensis]
MKLQFTINKLTDHHSNKSFKLLVKLLTILKFYTSNVHGNYNNGISKLIQGNIDSDQIVIKFYHDRIYLTTSLLNDNGQDQNPINTINVNFNINNFFQDYKLFTNQTENNEDLVIIKVNLKNLLSIVKKYDQLITYKNSNYSAPNSKNGNDVSSDGGLVGLRLDDNINNAIIKENKQPFHQGDDYNNTDFMRDMLKLNEMKKKQTSNGKRSEAYGDLTFKLIKVPKSWNIKADKINNSITGLGSLNVFYSEYVLSNAKNKNLNSERLSNGVKRNVQGYQITNNPLDVCSNYSGLSETDFSEDNISILKEKYLIVTHDFQVPIRMISINNDYKYRLENINSLIDNQADIGRIYALPILYSTGFYNDFNSPNKNNGNNDERTMGLKFNYYLKRSLRFDVKFGLLLKFQITSNLINGNFESYKLLTASQYGHKTGTNQKPNESCDSAHFKILINDFRNPQESTFHIELNWNKKISCLKIDSLDNLQETPENSNNVLLYDKPYESTKHNKATRRKKHNWSDMSEIEDSEYDKSYFAHKKEQPVVLESKLEGIDYEIDSGYNSNIEVNSQEVMKNRSESMSEEVEFSGDRILITNNDWKIFQKCYEILTNCQMYVNIGKMPSGEGKFCLINAVVPIEENLSDSYMTKSSNDSENSKLMEFHFYVNGV